MIGVGLPPFQSEIERGRAPLPEIIFFLREFRGTLVPLCSRDATGIAYMREEICSAGIRIGLFASQIPGPLETQATNEAFFHRFIGHLIKQELLICTGVRRSTRESALQPPHREQPTSSVALTLYQRFLE